MPLCGICRPHQLPPSDARLLRRRTASTLSDRGGLPATSSTCSTRCCLCRYRNGYAAKRTILTSLGFALPLCLAACGDDDDSKLDADAGQVQADAANTDPDAATEVAVNLDFAAMVGDEAFACSDGAGAATYDDVGTAASTVTSNRVHRRACSSQLAWPYERRLSHDLHMDEPRVQRPANADSSSALWRVSHRVGRLWKRRRSADALFNRPGLQRCQQWQLSVAERRLGRKHRARPRSRQDACIQFAQRCQPGKTLAMAATTHLRVSLCMALRSPSRREQTFWRF